MKYNVTKIHNGNYGVKARGGKYYINTESDDKTTVEKKALLMSIDWHMAQLREMEMILIDKYNYSSDDAYETIFGC